MECTIRRWKMEDAPALARALKMITSILRGVY